MEYRDFCETFMPLSDDLYKVAYCLLESESDAMDALQDLFLKLWEKRDSLDGIKNPKGYCITLLKNLCLDRLRTSERHRTGYLDDNPEPFSLESADAGT